MEGTIMEQLSFIRLAYLPVVGLLKAPTDRFSPSYPSEVWNFAIEDPDLMERVVGAIMTGINISWIGLQRPPAGCETCAPVPDPGAGPLIQRAVFQENLTSSRSPAQRDVGTTTEVNRWALSVTQDQGTDLFICLWTYHTHVFGLTGDIDKD